jgi:hypothetical protein
MHGIIRIFLFMLMLGAAAKPALGRCDSKTCSEAYNACMGIHCSEERGGKHCERHCRPLYDKCLQTGEFHGRQCQRTGLIKN